jgi:hypothetical protein
MRKLLLAALGAAGLLMLGTQQVICADLAGSIVDTKGNPVADAKILVKNLTNSVLSETHSNRNGRYQVTGITPGSYQYVLFPVSGFRGGDAVSYLSDKGLTIDWHVTDTAPAIAFASIGAGSSAPGPMAADDPYGFSNEEYAAILVGSVALVGGGVVGGLAAAGEFSGSSSNPPASPSL